MQNRLYFNFIVELYNTQISVTNYTENKTRRKGWFNYYEFRKRKNI